MSCLRWGVHLRQQAQVFFHDEQQEWQSPIHRIHLNVQACIPSTSSCRAFPENQIHSSTKHARQTSSLFIYNQEIPQCRRDDIRWRKRKRFLFTPSRQVSYLASVQPQFSGPISSQTKRSASQGSPCCARPQRNCRCACDDHVGRSIISISTISFLQTQRPVIETQDKSNRHEASAETQGQRHDRQEIRCQKETRRVQ